LSSRKRKKAGKDKPALLFGRSSDGIITLTYSAPIVKRKKEKVGN
jgi:hypothetical protein